MAVPIAAGSLLLRLAAPAAANGIRLAPGLAGRAAGRVLPAVFRSPLAPIPVTTVPRVLPAAPGALQQLAGALGRSLLAGFLLTASWVLGNRSQVSNNPYPPGLQQPVGTYNPNGVTIYQVTATASRYRGDCTIEPPINYGPGTFGTNAGQYLWVEAPPTPIGGNCVGMAVGPMRVRRGPTPGSSVGAETLATPFQGALANVSWNITSSASGPGTITWPPLPQGDPGSNEGLLREREQPAKPPPRAPAPPRVAPPITPNQNPPTPPAPPGPGRPLAPPQRVPIPRPGPRDGERPEPPPPRGDGQPAEVGQLVQSGGLQPLPRVPRFPSPDPARPSRQVGRDGKVEALPQGAPQPTPTGQRQYGPVIVGEPASRPRADLEGLATELGRIEQKLGSLLRRDPTGGFDPGDLLSQLEDLLRSILDGKPGGQYELYPSCPGPSGGAPPEPVVVEWTPSSDPIEDLRKRVDALALLLQAHKDMGQPSCVTPIVGRPVTVLFESDPL